MKAKSETYAEVDEKGRLIIPAEIAEDFGLQPGVRVSLRRLLHGVYVRQPVTHLKKVYIEPTTQCNLNCRMCVRNTWDEVLGQMAKTTFSSISKSLRTFSPPPTIIFDGFGEPLSHPHIAEMVAAMKKMGSQVELITNATLLSPDLAQRLIEAGLDVLWVSLDAATTAVYGDVRLGALLPQVIANVACIRDMLRPAHQPSLHIGVVFVAMRRTIADLPAVLQLGRTLGADRFLLPNVLPYSHELTSEVLYERALSERQTLRSAMVPQLNFTPIDMNDETRAALAKIMSSTRVLDFMQSSVSETTNLCPFIESGSIAVSWDGSVSPCLLLLHSHTVFLFERKRFSRRHVIGNVTEHGMQELWNMPEYVSFRERVQTFDFSPCVYCGGCNLSLSNEEDCIGNVFPTCGGCLWAQGIIQCP